MEIVIAPRPRVVTAALSTLVAIAALASHTVRAPIARASLGMPRKPTTIRPAPIALPELPAPRHRHPCKCLDHLVIPRSLDAVLLASRWPAPGCKVPGDRTVLRFRPVGARRTIRVGLDCSNAAGLVAHHRYRIRYWEGAQRSMTVLDATCVTTP